MPATEVIRYDPSQLGPNFPHAGFFAVPTTFLNTKYLGANGLNFTLNNIPIWASADSMLIEPRHFLSVLQLDLGSFIVDGRYYLEWIS